MSSKKAAGGAAAATHTGGAAAAAAGGAEATAIAQTIEKLALLQNLIKRDPETYADEFRLQYRNFQAELEIFKLNPSSEAATFKALVTFLSHVAACYRAELVEFPVHIVRLLTERGDALQGDVRRVLAQALMLMRNKGLIEAVPLLKVLFTLFRVRDKLLRQLIFQHIVLDIRAMNREKRDDNTNRAVQTFLYARLKEDAVAAPHAARKSLEVLVELYRRQIWTDARTVNVIASALTSPNPKLLVTALKFFLGVGSGTGGGGDGEDDDDDDDEDEDKPGKQVDAKTLREAKEAHAHSKQTRKRARQTARLVANLKKSAAKDKGSRGPVFPAIQLIHDPMGIAERLFSMLRTTGEGFEVRLLMMNMVSRLIGQHRLLLLPFYSYMQRYLVSHQKNVTQVLAILIQATHDLVPPDEMAPIVRTIANNFVSDRCPPEVIQVGLNGLREVLAHCPVVLEEPGMQELISDLVLYRKFRNKGVVAAARGVLNLIRDVFPSLLKRKDWGKDVATKADAGVARPTAYGTVKVATGVEGAELLALALAQKDLDSDAEEEDDDASDFEDGSEDDSEGEGGGAGRSSVASSKKSGGVAPTGVLAYAEDDEWEAVELSKIRAARRAGKTALAVKMQKALEARKAAAAAAEEAAGGAAKGKILRGKGGKILGKAAAGAADESDSDSEGGALDVILGSDDEDDHHHHGHGHDDEEEEEGSDHSDEEDDEEDEDEDEEEEEDVSDDEDDDEEEDEEEEEEASPAAGRKRARPQPDSDDEEDDDEDDEEEEPAEPSHKRRRLNDGSSEAASTGKRSGGAASSGTRASVADKLLARVAPLLGAGGAASAAAATAALRLDATRVMTPKDFERIRKIREKLVEKGIMAEGQSTLTAKEIMALLENPDARAAAAEAAGTGAARGADRQKKRRGARPGYDPRVGDGEDGEAPASSDDEDQLAIPGTTFGPAVAAVDPTWLESDATKKKRRAAERLREVLEAKEAKYEGKKPGGGLTNKEKGRFKNFLMLRHSSAVQNKMRETLSSQVRSVKKKLRGKMAKMDKRVKQRRRRA